MNEKWTDIRVSRKVHAFLSERGKKGESFNDVLIRLLGVPADAGV